MFFIVKIKDMSVLTHKICKPNFTYITRYCQLKSSSHIRSYDGFKVRSIPVAILLYCI